MHSLVGKVEKQRLVRLALAVVVDDLDGFLK